MITRATLMTALCAVAVTTAITLAATPAAVAHERTETSTSSQCSGTVTCTSTVDHDIRILGTLAYRDSATGQEVAGDTFLMSMPLIESWKTWDVDREDNADNKYKLVAYDHTNQVYERHGSFIPDGKGGGSDRWVLIVDTKYADNASAQQAVGWLNAVSLAPGW